MAEREAKPLWSAVPARVRQRTERLLGSPVTGARRSFGGFGPSATFVLRLQDGRGAFFKGVYPLPEDSAVRWMLDEEERVYERLQDFINPWAPTYYGSLREQGWHVILIEAVGGERALPWTVDKAMRAARSYAEFHGTTAGRALPRWLPRDGHLEFAEFWQSIAADADAQARLAVLGGAQTRRWLDVALPALIEGERRFGALRDPYALLHSDTRSDNVRLNGRLLRIFDWPFAFAGPTEFDLAAFAQSIASEGGPDPEQVVGWYAQVSAPRDDALTHAAVGIAGYFADRAPRPEMPGLPRLRAHQRRQLKASLRWAARRLGLVEPRWLDRVPD